MALHDFASLKTAVADWISRSNLTGIDARAEEFIALFEAQANRELDVRDMVDTILLSVSDETAALPCDFAGVLSFRLTEPQSPELQYVKPSELDGTFRLGKPERYTITDSLVFDPVPDGEYEARLRYRKRIPSLGPGMPTNWLLQRHPDAYLYGALSQALIYFRDDDRQVIRNAYASALDAITQDDKRVSQPATVNATGRPF